MSPVLLPEKHVLWPNMGLLFFYMYCVTLCEHHFYVNVNKKFQFEDLRILDSKVWEEEVVSGKWNERKVLLLHKGGNKSRQFLKNYRPISLVSTIGIFLAIY